MLAEYRSKSSIEVSPDVIGIYTLEFHLDGTKINGENNT